MSTYVSPYAIIYVSPKVEEVGKMSAKMGRPTDNPKCYETRIRMDSEDIRKLDYCCKITKVTQSEVIRHGINLIYYALTIGKESKGQKAQKKSK